MFMFTILHLLSGYPEHTNLMPLWTSVKCQTLHLPHAKCFHPFLPPLSAEQTTNAVPTVMTPPQKHFYSHVFFIHLHACFLHTFVCGFFSYIYMRVCMRVFVIHLYAILYAGFFHIFVCVFFSYICMRFCMRVFFIHLNAGLYACFCHTFGCVFFSYICMRVCMRVFFHTFVCVFICVFFFIHLYACFCHTFVCGFL